MSKEKVTKKIVLLAIWSLTFFIYLIMIANKGIEPDADNLLYMVFGRSIFSGNVTLSGAYACTNSFYLLSLLYGVLGCVFGYKVGLVYIVSSLLFATALCLICYIILEENKGKSIWDNTFAILICIAFSFSSVYFNTGSNIYAGAHFDIAIISILAMYIISREFQKERFNYRKLSIIYILLFIGACSDFLLIYFTLIPMFLVLLLNFYMCKNDAIHKNFLMIQMGSILSITIFSKILLNFIEKIGGLIVPASKMEISMIGLDEIWNRISYFFEVILGLFDANVMGKTIAFANVEIFLGAVILFAFLCFLSLDIKRLLKDIYVQMQVAVILLITLILVFTSYVLIPEGMYVSRLIYFLFFSILILFSKVNYSRVLERLNLNKKPIMICISVMMGAIFICSLKEISFIQKEESPYEEVARILEEKGLEKGFAPFWLTHPITVASNFEVEVASIEGIVPSRLNWNSLSTKEWDYANFIVIDDSGQFDITKESIEMALGVPSEIISEGNTGNMLIYVWDKNIIPYIRGASYENISLKAVNMKYSTEAVIVDKSSLEIPKGQLMYGPYIELQEGMYRIRFTGDGLEKTKADIYSVSYEQKEESLIKFNVISQTNQEIILEAILPKTFTDIETRLINQSDENIRCDEIQIERIYNEK